MSAYLPPFQYLPSHSLLPCQSQQNTLLAQETLPFCGVQKIFKPKFSQGNDVPSLSLDSINSSFVLTTDLSKKNSESETNVTFTELDPQAGRQNIDQGEISVIVEFEHSGCKDLYRSIRPKYSGASISLGSILQQILALGTCLSGVTISYLEQPRGQFKLVGTTEEILQDAEHTSLHASNCLVDNRLTIQCVLSNRETQKQPRNNIMGKSQPAVSSTRKIASSDSQQGIFKQLPEQMAFISFPFNSEIQLGGSCQSSDPLSSDSDASSHSDTPENKLTQIWQGESSCRRTKERRIDYVVEKVSLWRKYYNGIDIGRGTLTRFSLKEAAKKVGISKKSLDDYLLQLRCGKRYGFDFKKHKLDNIGVLRTFVKKQKMMGTKEKRALQSDPIPDLNDIFKRHVQPQSLVENDILEHAQKFLKLMKAGGTVGPAK